MMMTVFDNLDKLIDVRMEEINEEMLNKMVLKSKLDHVIRNPKHKLWLLAFLIISEILFIP